jgi:hypothetical protein
VKVEKLMVHFYLNFGKFDEIEAKNAQPKCTVIKTIDAAVLFVLTFGLVVNSYK